jgi:hypothetical protein
MPVQHAVLLTAVDSSVENICQKGCRRVREDIAALERGEVIEEVALLDATERARVLAELKSIMAVYGGACRL